MPAKPSEEYVSEPILLVTGLCVGIERNELINGAKPAARGAVAELLGRL